MSEHIEQKQTLDEKFVGRLEKYVKDEDRAALAHLRRGLGKDAWTATEMFPYVAGWTANLSRRDENAYFLVASLVGLYPTYSWKPTEKIKFNNLGKSLSFLSEDSGSIEKRFTALLNADDEDLSEHLRQIVSLLKSKEAPINWHQLLRDIKNWSHENRFVQRSWAKGFWGNLEENKEHKEGEEKQI
ncbi:MAG: type I-E CRISPR-associated protein Cse2/CasB [Pyrinomonadaceae bacterium]|nr:type I-E CRISPR-associated protein Cse2/CasB [Pyrinomonadaceae bacterium]